jgi:hypothetical protein
MKIVRYILIVSSSLLLLIFIIGILSPSKYEIKRSIEINDSPSNIEPYLMNIANWEKWSYMSSKKDTSIKFSYYPTRFGDSTYAKWESKYMGTGTIKIYDYKPNIKINYELLINENEHKINGTFTFKFQDNKTLLTWIDYGELGFNPIARIFGLFMEKFIGNDQEESLKNLKNLIENQ